jgi:hypothetical protein
MAVGGVTLCRFGLGARVANTLKSGLSDNGGNGVNGGGVGRSGRDRKLNSQRNWRRRGGRAGDSGGRVGRELDSWWKQWCLRGG